MQSNAVQWRVLLIGLEPRDALELSVTLSSLGYRNVVQAAVEDPWELLPGAAALIFCSAENACFERVLGRVRPGVPVIVASRLPDVAAWLDAMDQGASDYCAAPFDASSIGWIIDSSVHAAHTPRLSRAAA